MNRIASAAGFLMLIACTETTGPNASDVPGFMISSVLVGPEVDTLYVDPNAPPGQGEQRLFIGIAYGKNGAVLDGVQFYWKSSNAAVAMINDDGLVTAMSTGTVEITASADKVGKATLVVLPLQLPPGF